MFGIILIIGIIALILCFFGGNIAVFMIMAAPMFGIIYLFEQLGLPDYLVYFLTLILFVVSITGIYLYFNEEAKYYRRNLEQFQLKVRNYSNEQKQNELIVQKKFLLTYEPNKIYPPGREKALYDLEFKLSKKYIEVLESENSNNIFQKFFKLKSKSI